MRDSVGAAPHWPPGMEVSRWNGAARRRILPNPAWKPEKRFQKPQKTLQKPEKRLQKREKRLQKPQICSWLLRFHLKSLRSGVRSWEFQFGSLRFASGSARFSSEALDSGSEALVEAVTLEREPPQSR